MKQTLKLAAAVLLMAGLVCACTPEIELAGSAWSGSVDVDAYADEDNDAYVATYTLVCNSARKGMLFLTVSYYDDAMPLCFAMPVSYTWDGGKGTATATLSHPEIGNKTFSIPLSWSKTSGLLASFTSIEQGLEIRSPLSLEQKSFAKPASMDGTTWTVEFDEDMDHFVYELKFVSASAAVLNLTMVEGEDSENMRWNVNYSYSEGIGTTSIFWEGENIRGGFYMPDATHMIFSDGENGLSFTKQQ